MRSPHWTLAVWLRIQEPRIVTVLQFVIYLCAAAAGYLALMNPPRSIEATAGAGLTFYWSILLLGGGLLGAATVLPGWWLFERAATIACFGAASIYGVNLFSLDIAQSGNRLTQLLMVAIAALHFAARWFRIRRYSFDPER
ncbi:hypothetical protein ACSYDW_01395 [Paeniglutamicibacter sp. R2-26]|uniref:hypothetical protein n=1 Tax=Paeniglutamicibacter sp. R2-26 TaxID=3144417 RepID=UPI003EE50E5A